LSWLAIIVALQAKAVDASAVDWSTLIGAVVGGALSLLGTILVERQRGKTTNKTERRRQELEGRLAARLTVVELEDARSILRVALARKPYRWPPSDDFEFEIGAWLAHSAALAAAVPDRQWELVAGPYFSYRSANLLEEVSERTAEKMLSVTDEAIEALKEWVDTVDASQSS